MKRFLLFGVVMSMVSALLLVSTGCKKESNPADSGNQLEEVLPNVVTLTLTSSNPQEIVKAIWRSTSTAVNAAAVVRIDTLRLTAGRTYTGIIEAQNDLKTPIIDLTQDYKRLQDEHQFFYTPTVGISNRVTFILTDKDSKGLPIGLNYTVSVSAGGVVSGNLNVILGHYDDVKKDGITRSPESDIDITFPVAVQ